MPCTQGVGKPPPSTGLQCNEEERQINGPWWFRLMSAWMRDVCRENSTPVLGELGMVFLEELTSDSKFEGQSGSVLRTE